MADPPGVALLLTTWTLLSAIATSWATPTEQTTCKKDESLPDRFDFNVYYCPGKEGDVDTDKTECCQVDSRFSCCAPQLNHAVEQQAILWGCLGGSIALVMVLCVCYHRDSRCCDSWQPCCPCRIRKRKEEEAPIVIDDADFFNPAEDLSRIKTAMSFGNKRSDDDSGRGSGSTTPSFLRNESARSQRSTAKSPGSEDEGVSTANDPRGMADVEL